MPSVEDTTDIQLRLALSEADVSTLFQESSSVVRRLRGHKYGTAGVGADSSQRNENRQEDLASNQHTGNIVAHYSQQNSSLEVSGYLHPRLPLRFNLRPGSQTYYNFLQYMLCELDEIDLAPSSAGDIGLEGREALSRLKESLTEALSASGRLSEKVSLDILGSDFEMRANRPRLEKRRLSSHGVGRSLLPDSYSAGSKKEFLVRGRQHSELQHISGFLTLEINQVVTPSRQQGKDSTLSRDRIHWLSPIQARSVTEGVLLRVELAHAEALAEDYDVYFRWGALSEGARPWVDEEVRLDRVAIETAQTRASDTLVLETLVRPNVRGRYGACAYAKNRHNGEEVWLSHAGYSDTIFDSQGFQGGQAVEVVCRELLDRLTIQQKIVQSVGSYEQFVRCIAQLDKDPAVRGLSRHLFEVAGQNSGLTEVLNRYYRKALLEVEEERSTPKLSSPGAMEASVVVEKRRGISGSRLRRVISILQSVGIGEVVFIAPEGPQAIAGGLAQVVVGLSKSLVLSGTSCTIISTLYHEAQGSKHCSAQDILNNGLPLMGARVPLTLAGKVRIAFGETRFSGTDRCKSHPRTVVAEVYLAEHQGLRVYLLHHPILGDSLYSGNSSEEQLRKALFLSRGALEILKADEFSIHPHLLLSNDWPSALVPALLKLDPAYAGNSRLKDVETCHILHNAGPAYQGRFYVNEFGVDVWPMTGLGDEHFFGLSDTADSRFLNLTSGAIVHSSKGVVTVSRPYADQLFCSDADENLSTVLTANEASLFGISNGIDLETLREVFWKGGEGARHTLGESTLLKTYRKSSRLLRHISSYKASLKRVVQREYGLAEGHESILISFVGRLTEQKGIALLSAPECSSGRSVLEEVLEAHPKVQFLIGGPPSPGDTTCDALRAEIERLAHLYPGRIKGFFSFVPHQSAIQITQASDFFLMPSRYEPGGITQLEALASGTLVFARNSGGLSATLRDFRPERNDGDSFLFEEYTCDALRDCIERGLSVFAEQNLRDALILQAASAQNDWKHRVPKYRALFQHLAGVLGSMPNCSFLRGKQELLSGLSAEVRLAGAP